MPLIGLIILLLISYKMFEISHVMQNAQIIVFL